MKYIQPMNCEEFAQHLLTLYNGDTVEFGTDPGVEWPDETPDIDDVTVWYFVRVINIPEYESRFILIDYCGGECAFAIPLNNYKNGCDEDDKRVVMDKVKEFFKNCDDVDDYVFVEMEDDE